MPKYLLAYTGGSTPESDAEQQTVMAAWGRWFGELGSAVVDGGNPFSVSATVRADGTSAGGTSGLTGYSVVEAGDLQAASDMARGCPILTSGGTVEVYETFDVAG